MKIKPQEWVDLISKIDHRHVVDSMFGDGHHCKKKQIDGAYVTGQILSDLIETIIALSKQESADFTEYLDKDGCVDLIYFVDNLLQSVAFEIGYELGFDTDTTVKINYNKGEVCG